MPTGDRVRLRAGIRGRDAGGFELNELWLVDVCAVIGWISGDRNAFLSLMQAFLTVMRSCFTPEHTCRKTPFSSPIPRVGIRG